MMCNAHHKPFNSVGVRRACLKAPEALSFEILSHAIWGLYFEEFWYKTEQGEKK